MDVTLLELNMQGAESEIHLPFSGSVTKSVGTEEEDVDTSSETTNRFSAGESGGSAKGKGIGVLVGLAFLIAIAALAKRRRGGEDDGDGSVDIETADDESDVVTVSDED